MGSRVRVGKHRLFEVVVEIKRLKEEVTNHPFTFCFPNDYNDEELLKSIPEFAFPFSSEFISPSVDHFTFVLTDIDGKFRFGFCRLSALSKTSLCLVSYYPWFEIFYRLLNYVAEIQSSDNDSDFLSLLVSLVSLDVCLPGTELHATNRRKTKVFHFTTPDSSAIPSIPDNRNLTEYYHTIDAYNMMIIFASMLFERRILVVSRKLSRLTSCVHGAASLFYPLHWQHIYIPIMPPHLVNYCCAPMPYLIGIHETLMSQVVKSELGDAIILDADTNSVSGCYDDLSLLPSKVGSFLKKELGAHKKNKASTPRVLMGQAVPRAFLRSLVQLIGGYRDAFVKTGGELTFDKALFLETRSSSVQPFLEHILHVQAFEQFISDRLQIFQENPNFVDDFESENSAYKVEKQSKGKYKVMWPNYDKALSDIANKVKTTSISTYKTVKSTLNDFKEMDFNRRRTTDVNIKALATSTDDKTLPLDDSEEQKQLSQMLRTTKQRQGNAVEGNRRCSFRLSSDDSEVLDKILQASLPLLTDGDMERMFRKYSFDNLDNVSQSDDSDVSRDNLSTTSRDHLPLRYESLKFFGNRNSSSRNNFPSAEVNSRMASSTPNIIELNKESKEENDKSSVAPPEIEIQGSNKTVFEVNFDSNHLSKASASLKSDLAMKNEDGESDIVRRFNKMIGRSDFENRRSKRLSVRYLPNVRQMIQRYENSSAPETSADAIHSKSFQHFHGCELPESLTGHVQSKSIFRFHGNGPSESLVASQAARYMSLDRNARLDPGPDLKARTFDVRF